MGLFDIFRDSNNIVVKQGTSKGPGKPKVSITIGDIRRGRVVDENGYSSDIVLFLRTSKVKRESLA